MSLAQFSPPPASQVQTLISLLKECYPDAHCELNHQNPWQLLVATILSAQSTDKRVNQVTPALFARYPDVFALAEAELPALEEVIYATGFFRQKAKFLRESARLLVAEHAGQVPADLQALIRLPGVARKTANVVLGNAFNITAGIVVDTHVRRLSQRLGWSVQDDPVKIEQDLQMLIPQDDWILISHLLIFHGRRICIAQKPRCSNCRLRELCPSAQP